MDEPVDFVFSFRSPYAWIAARWVLPQLPSTMAVRWRPFFPLPTFQNFPPLMPAKLTYLIKDVTRLVAHYGGELRWPGAEDPNWAIPHCAFLEADAQGRGSAFGLGIYEARFGKGEAVANLDVIASVAASVGLDAGAVVAAAQDKAGHRALVAEVQRHYDERGIFGVPTLILPRGTRYWGHDRIEWAIRERRIPGL